MAKVYSDGSHYIAIPHTAKPSSRKPKTVSESNISEIDKDDGGECEISDNETTEREDSVKDKVENTTDKKETSNSFSLKDVFERLYRESALLCRQERREHILNGIRPYLDSDTSAKAFVEVNLERKYRNKITRRIRLMRKVYLHDFNCFVTFTYDDGLHTEQSFRKTLKNCLSHFSSRNGWRYIGVWERSPQKQRLHFHGIFMIPHNAIPGDIGEIKSYNTADKKMQTTRESSYFRQRFGRNDFRFFDSKTEVLDAVKYLMKYLEKPAKNLFTRADCRSILFRISWTKTYCAK